MSEAVSQLLNLPGAKTHETVPAVAKLIWTNHIPMKIKGWEGDEDQALIQTLMPAKESLKVPQFQDASSFETFSLRSYGRGDILALEESVVIGGVSYNYATRKGIGSAQQPVVEKGEVYGTPAKLNKKNYSAGFTNQYTFDEDRHQTEVWNKAKLRVRQPMRCFDLKRVFMTTGSEAVSELAKKFEHAEGAVETVWVTRNPITFEDAQQFFMEYSDPPNFPKLKEVADNLLRVQAEFLKNDEDVRARKVAEIVKKGSGEGENEWFSLVATMYGEQMMRKTSNGLIAGEKHRQNDSLGIESKDLGDVSGMNETFRESEKNYGSWENAKKTKDAAREITKENILQLAEIADLKVAFNVANERGWNDGVDEIVNDFLSGMQNENPEIFQDVIYNMLRMVTHNSSNFQYDRQTNKLYGISNLCFGDYMGNEKPKLPNTPVSAEFLLSDIFTNIESKIDPSALPDKLREHFPFDHYSFQYKDLWSEEDILTYSKLYNETLNRPDFPDLFNEFISLTLTETEADNVEIMEELLDKVKEKFQSVLDSKFEFEEDKYQFLRVFLGESGILNFWANVIGRPANQREAFVKNNKPELPTLIDTKPMQEYIDKYY